VSRDGGATFDNFKVSESPFNPTAAIFFGDYTNISAYNNVIRPVWARLHNGSMSIITAIVDSLYVGVAPEKEQAVPFSLDQNYPNPAADYTWFSYKIHRPTRVTLKVFDLYGKEVACLLSDNPKMPGKYTEWFDFRGHGFTPGFYYFSMVSGEQTVKRKMIIE
jgi:hypothetical protein